MQNKFYFASLTSTLNYPSVKYFYTYYNKYQNKYYMASDIKKNSATVFFLSSLDGAQKLLSKTDKEGKSHHVLSSKSSKYQSLL